MSFSVAPAPEEFQCRLNEALEGLDGVRTIADDIIVFGVGDTGDEAVVDHDRSNGMEKCPLGKRRISLRNPKKQ